MQVKTGAGQDAGAVICELRTAGRDQAWGGPLACGAGNEKEGGAGGWSSRSAGAAGIVSPAETGSMKSSRALSSRQSSHSSADSASSCPSISCTCASRATWATSSSRQTRTTRAGDSNRPITCRFSFIRSISPVVPCRPPSQHIIIRPMPKLGQAAVAAQDISDFLVAVSDMFSVWTRYSFGVRQSSAQWGLW